MSLPKHKQVKISHQYSSQYNSRRRSGWSCAVVAPVAVVVVVVVEVVVVVVVEVVVVWPYAAAMQPMVANMATLPFLSSDSRRRRKVSTSPSLDKPKGSKYPSGASRIGEFGQGHLKIQPTKTARLKTSQDLIWQYKSIGGLYRQSFNHCESSVHLHGVLDIPGLHTQLVLESPQWRVSVVGPVAPGRACQSILEEHALGANDI